MLWLPTCRAMPMPRATVQLLDQQSMVLLKSNPCAPLAPHTLNTFIPTVHPCQPCSPAAPARSASCGHWHQPQQSRRTPITRSTGSSLKQVSSHATVTTPQVSTQLQLLPPLASTACMSTTALAVQQRLGSVHADHADHGYGLQE